MDLEQQCKTQDQFLTDNIAGFTNDILKAFYAGVFNPTAPGESVFDVVKTADGRLGVITAGVVGAAQQAGLAAESADDIAIRLGSMIVLADEDDFNGQPIPSANDQLLRVDVNGIKLPNVATPGVGNTAGLLPDIGLDNQETGTRLSTHTLLRGVNIKNTSGTGIIHIGFSEESVDGPAPIGGYQLHSREEVFIETSNLNNLWVSSCPGASGCYIGG